MCTIIQRRALSTEHTVHIAQNREHSVCACVGGSPSSPHQTYAGSLAAEGAYSSLVTRYLCCFGDSPGEGGKGSAVLTGKGVKTSASPVCAGTGAGEVAGTGAGEDAGAGAGAGGRVASSWLSLRLFSLSVSSSLLSFRSVFAFRLCIMENSCRARLSAELGFIAFLRVLFRVKLMSWSSLAVSVIEC
jgi:hypothetical protein